MPPHSITQVPGALVKPAALRKGDRIGIVAPASPVKRELLERGSATLRGLGYDPVFEESILSKELFYAGSVRRRADELEAMFRRDDVQAIICARGGYGCAYLLPEIDIDLIRRHPKIFAGYSDVTSLLTWIHDAAGLATFHAPMVASDFSAEGGVDLFSWQAALEGRNAGHQISQLEIIAPGSAEGRLYGGCLSLLAASLGTPYAIQTEGSILFLEDVSAKPFQIDRMLMQLRLARRLEGIRGIVFGRMRDCEAPTDSDYTLQDVLRRGLSDLDIPICYGLNSGHVENNNLTLPLGVQVRLLATEDFASLTFLEAAVMQN